jgi:hypothetical protein
MEIITDLEYISELAEKRAEENWEFRSFLKQVDLSRQELDAIVHQKVDEVTEQIDCTKCANCCKQIRPVLEKDDVERFALGLQISVVEVKEKYLKSEDEQTSRYQFNALPCPFLENNLCSNYDHRPEVCRSFPHLHKEDFVSRLWRVVENYEICPIVFNVYERLKMELWHSSWLGEEDFGFDWF